MKGFRNFLRETEANKAKTVIDGSNLILFFKRGNDLFGAPEESRLTFAKLKHPDPEDAGSFDDASFLAINLIDALMGKTTQNLFGKKDIGKITILDRDDCEKMLLRQGANKPKIAKNLGKKQGNDDGMIHIDDSE